MISTIFRFTTFVCALLFYLVSYCVADEATVGKSAPQFSRTAVDDKNYTLQELQGKYVVLEWFNHECPFVKKHYNSGNMQRLQKELTDDGVIWLAVNSSAQGKQGHIDKEQAQAVMKEKGAHVTAILLDENGELGKQYGAKTTPHMFLIDPAGTIIYAGAIDDKPSTDVEDVPEAKNYVREAYKEALAGKNITVVSTDPYGCGVKYKS